MHVVVRVQYFFVRDILYFALLRIYSYLVVDIRGVNRAGPKRAGPNNFNSLAIRAGSSKIFKDAGRIQLKNEF